MSNNKSFFQKISESLTSLFPFNSSTKDIPSLSHVPFEKHLSPIRLPVNRRVASVAFGDDSDIDKDEMKVKRAKLHHDPMSFPTSRIIKPPIPNVTALNKLSSLNNFNDAASDHSDASNISVSTSGVSSLHPKSNKRINLMDNKCVDDVVGNIKYPRNLNLSYSQVHGQDLPLILTDGKNIKSKFTNNFISSPARKILEKLDRLTTPLTAADRLSCTIIKERNALTNNNGPYSRRSNQQPPIIGRKPHPLKAITVNASSVSESSCGPIRRKQTIIENKTKRVFGCNDLDNIDLDSEIVPGFVGSSKKLNFSNLPLLKKSQSTSTDDLPKQDSSLNKRESSPVLEFTFRPPNSIDDEAYRISNFQDDLSKPVEYKFKSKISADEITRHEQKYVDHNLLRNDSSANVLWRCNTCFLENQQETLECTNCGNLSKVNFNKKVLLEKSQKSIIDDKVGQVTNVLENKKSSEKPLESNPPSSSFLFGAAPTTSINMTTGAFSFGSNITKESTSATIGTAPVVSSVNTIPKLIVSETATMPTAPVLSFGNNSAKATTDTSPTSIASNFSFGNNSVKATIDSTSTKSNTTPAFSFGANLPSSSGVFASSYVSTSGSLFSSSSVSKESSLFGTVNTNSVSNSTVDPNPSLLFGTSVSSPLLMTTSSVPSTVSSSPFVFTSKPNADATKLAQSLETKTSSNASVTFGPKDSTLLPVKVTNAPFVFGQTSSTKEKQKGKEIPEVSKDQSSTKFTFGPATTSTGETVAKSSFVFGVNPNSENKPNTEVNKQRNSPFTFNSMDKTADSSAPKTSLFGTNGSSALPGQNLFGAKNSTQFSFTNSSSSSSVTSTSSDTFAFGSAQIPSMNFGQVSNSTLSSLTTVSQPSFNFTMPNSSNPQLVAAPMPSSIKNFDFGSASNAFSVPTSNDNSRPNFSSTSVFQFNSGSNSDVKSNTFSNSTTAPRRTLKPRKKKI